MADEKDALLDAQGRGAEDKFKLEITSHILGRIIQGVRYCAHDTIEGEDVSTIILSLDNSQQLTIAVKSDATVSIWIKNDSKQVEIGPPVNGFVM